MDMDIDFYLAVSRNSGSFFAGASIDSEAGP